MNIFHRLESIATMLISIWLFPTHALVTFRLPSYFNRTDKQILDSLLSTKIYDKNVLPAETTIVNVSVLLLSMSSPDESSLKYELEFLLHQDWHDHRLIYNDGGRYPYLNALRHHGLLWRPDTYFILHGEFKALRDPGPVDMALKIFPNGTVLYITRQKMVITCEGDLDIFPFDNPRCFFAVESMSYEADRLQFRWKSANDTPIIKALSFRYLNAYLSKNATGECQWTHSWRTEFSCLSVYLIFTRDKLFYFSTVFVPGMVLVTSSFISFWLDVNAVPARVMIGVTTMLNFCTTTNSFRSSLPVVSNLTAMNLWDGVCMFFIYASMIEFIIVNYLHRRYHSPSMKLESHDLYSTNCRYILENQLQAGRNISNEEKLAQNELEVRSPLVDGEDSTISGSELNHRNRTGDNFNLSEQQNAASVFAWLPKSTIKKSFELSPQAKMSRSIDHISKFVFPFLFGVFSLTFFIYFAWYSPAQLKNWIDLEYNNPSF